MTEQRPLLVLIGPPGAGKSAVGRLTASLISAPFVDTDDRIVKRHGPIPAIFAERGEPIFRLLEREEVARAMAERCVLALGGGAVLDEQTQQDLASNTVVYLTVSADAVSARIRKPTRPLLRDGIASWNTLLAQRRGIYERLATRTVDGSHRSAASIAHELAKWLEQEGKT